MSVLPKNIKLALSHAAAGRQEAALSLFAGLWTGHLADEKSVLLIAEAMAQCGYFKDAMPYLQQALSHHGETTGLCYLMGKIAVQLSMYDIAQKLLVRAVELDGKNFPAYVELAKCNIEENAFDAAIDMLQQLQPHDPKNAEIDNVLGNAMLAKTGDDAAARPYYEQAYAKNKKSAIIAHNLAMTSGITDKAEMLYKRALQLSPHAPKIKLSYAIFLLHQGRLREAWPLYENRLLANDGQSPLVRYKHDLPIWQGEDLTGKSLFLLAEQGVGDEIIFSTVVNRLAAVAARVYISCDPRLVDVYRRSYPVAGVYGYEDQQDFGGRVRRFPALGDDLATGRAQIDYMIPAASAFAKIVTSADETDKLNWSGLQPDTALSDELGDFVAQRHRSGRLKIAISWTSGNLKGARNTFYPGLEALLGLLNNQDADYFVSQYEVTAAERDSLQAYPNVHFFDGYDLKADIEANIALFTHMDIAIGPMIATQTFALAAGCAVWLLSYGRPWNFLGRRCPPGYYPADSLAFDRKTPEVDSSSYTSQLQEAIACFKSEDKSALQQLMFSHSEDFRLFEAYLEESDVRAARQHLREIMPHISAPDFAEYMQACVDVFGKRKNEARQKLKEISLNENIVASFAHRFLNKK